MEPQYYVLILFIPILIVSNLIGYCKCQEDFPEADSYFKTDYFGLFTVISVMGILYLMFSLACIVESSTNINIVGKENISEVTYTIIDEQPEFKFKYSDEENYSSLKVIYRDDIDIPYVGEIVQSSKTGMVKVKYKALVLNSSFKEYTDIPMYSDNDSKLYEKVLYKDRKVT